MNEELWGSSMHGDAAKDSCAGGRCLISAVLSCVGDGFEKMLDVEGVSLHQPFKDRLMLGRSKKFIQPAVLPAPGEHRGPSLLSCCENHLQRVPGACGKNFGDHARNRDIRPFVQRLLVPYTTERSGG